MINIRNKSLQKVDSALDIYDTRQRENRWKHDIIDFDEECGATLEIPNQDNVWVIQLKVTPQDGYYTGREYSLSISDIPGTALNWR